MADLMDDHSQVDNVHPAVWAPFVVVGEYETAARPLGAGGPFV